MKKLIVTTLLLALTSLLSGCIVLSGDGDGEDNHHRRHRHHNSREF